MVRLPLRYVPVIAREYVWRLVLDREIEIELSEVEPLADELARVLRKRFSTELAAAVAARPLDALVMSELPEGLLGLSGNELGEAVPLEELLDRFGIVVGEAALLRIVQCTVSSLRTSANVGSIPASDASLCTKLRKLLERHRQPERNGRMEPGPPPASSGGAGPASAPAQVGRPDPVWRRPPEPDDGFDLR